MRRRLRDERGFTLMELMTTLGVVAVLLGIAIPTIQFQIARQELRSAAREVSQVLRAARDSAVNEQVPRYVLFDPATDSYQVFRFDGTDWVEGRNRVSLRVSFDDGDVTFPSVSDAPVAGASVPENAAYFDTRGRYPFGHTGSYEITLRGGLGRSATLTLHPQTGQVTGV